VPQGLAGTFYWNPGNSTKRIPVHVESAGAARRTLAKADAGTPTSKTPAAAAAATIAPSPPAVSDRTDGRPQVAKPLITPLAMTASTSKRVATATPQRAAKQRPSAKDARRRRSQAVASANAEQARRQACEELLSRNDVQARDASRPFYLLNCPDYPLPSNWTAPVVALVSPPQGRVDCRPNAPRAAQLVCRDPFLSSLDRRLAASYSRALKTVDDPDALRRNQADWRDRVRDACGTTGCLERAYGRWTAHMDALGKVGP
jgi:hypothetical protein